MRLPRADRSGALCACRCEGLADGGGRITTELLELQRRMPSLDVLGGCCGTDERHIEALARAWRGAPARRVG